MEELIGSGAILTVIATITWALGKFLLKDWYEKSKKITEIEYRHARSAIDILEKEVVTIRGAIYSLDKNVTELRHKIISHQSKIEEHTAFLKESTNVQKTELKDYMKLVHERFKLIEEKTEKIRIGQQAFLHKTRKGDSQ